MSQPLNNYRSPSWPIVWLNVWINGDLATKLKRQFLPSADWKQLLKDSALPAPVLTLIRTVVTQSRLMRFEKYEIAIDLIHHFQDGHEQGRTYDELIEHFGDASIASQLFRTSKLRNRPMSIKAAKGILGLLGGSFVGFIALHLFYNSAVPNPTIDYSAKLNEAVTSMPDDQKAWPQYRDLWAKYGLSEGGDFDDSAFYVADETADPSSNQKRLVRPSDPEWPAAVARLESMSEILTMFRDNAQLPYLGTPLHVDLNRYSEEDFAALMPNRSKSEANQFMDWGMDLVISEEAAELLNRSSGSILLPHVQRFRAFTRYFTLDTQLAVEQGDQERALTNLKTIFGLARQVGNSPIVVQKLVGRANYSTAFQQTQRTLDQHPDFFSDAQLADLRNYLNEMKPIIEIPEDIEGEINLTKDLIQRIYSDDGNGDGRITPIGTEILLATEQFTFVSGEPTRRSLSFTDKAFGPAQLFSAATRKEVIAALEDVIEKCTKEASKPLYEKSDFDFKEYAKSKGPGDLLESIGSSFEILQESRERFLAQRDCTILGIAAHEFRRKHERWPQSLDELVNYQDVSAPLDPHTGSPIKFASGEKSFRIYSVGSNGIDEQGESDDSNWRFGDKDWRLWPLYDEAP